MLPYSLYSPPPNVPVSSPNGALSADPPPSLYVATINLLISTTGAAGVPVPWELQLTNANYEAVLEVCL